MQLLYYAKTIFFDCDVTYSQNTQTGGYQLATESWKYTIWNDSGTLQEYSSVTDTPNGFFSFSQAMNSALARVTNSVVSLGAPTDVQPSNSFPFAYAT